MSALYKFAIHMYKCNCKGSYILQGDGDSLFTVTVNKLSPSPWRAVEAFILAVMSLRIGPASLWFSCESPTLVDQSVNAVIAPE